MAWYAKTIESLCHDKKTIDEAKRLLQAARANTGVGSGFDLGEDRTGLAAVCAFLASQNLNNTNVTFEAAQFASCQTKAKFKKLHAQVGKALETRKRAKREPLSYKVLLVEHYPKVTRHAVPFMEEAEVLVMEKVDGDKHDHLTDDEVTCAVFAWVCNVIERKRVFHSKSFVDNYETDPKHMLQLSTIIKTVCGHDMEAKIQVDYAAAVESAKLIIVSPRKSPVKPGRTLPSRGSPQKRKVTLPDVEEDSPTKRRKVTPSASLVTLESIRTRSMTSSPVKPSTPRKLPPSPSKSPTKTPVTITPIRAVKLFPVDDGDALSSSDEEDHEPPPRRRFRPVFRDQKQWEMGDPRLNKLAETAFHERMVQRHGLPFGNCR
ncbi:hypothetical protein DFH06DRAFT_420307 [Mycena polygramma]|nr:hypothetical protein DFH06DRAFT_420307 [Mycena polygramma]